jgi:hypothetical protein
MTGHSFWGTGMLKRSLIAVELRSSTINNHDILFSLIARRSRYRAGTRYFTRGIDTTGHVANYNETEQMVLTDPINVDPRTGFAMGGNGRVEGKERNSFVQIRGSIPLFWAEVNNLRYKPDMQVMELPETASRILTYVTHNLLLTESSCVNRSKR